MLTGKLWYHFAVAILLTVVISRIALAWYRRSVTRSMETTGCVPTETTSGFEQERTVWRPGGWARPQDRQKGVAAEAWLYRRIVVVYGLGGLAASAVLTTLSLVALGVPVRPLRTSIIFYTYCWPIVPMLSFLLAAPRRRALLALVTYVVAGLLMTLILSATDTNPLQTALRFLLLLAMQASLPFLIILSTSGRRVRSVAPFVLAGLLVFSFSNLVVGDAFFAALDLALVQSVMNSWAGDFIYNGWFMLAALPIGYVCWRGLRWLGRNFEQKSFSDTQLLVDAWWLIITFVFSIFRVNDFGWRGILGLAAFVAYRAVVATGFVLWRINDDGLGNTRLLLLRVFGFQRRTESLFDSVAQRWRWLGSVRLIAGADLATRIIGPDDLISFMGGRLRQLFLRPDTTSLQRLDRFDEARDPDGRFRINKIYCYQDSWQPALRKMLATTDRVLMDLRGFSDKNQGCLFELQQLVEHDVVRRTVFVVDDTTDVHLLETVLSDQTQSSSKSSERDTAPINLVSARSGSAADTDRVYHALRELAV